MDNKLKRSQRMVLITKILTENPGKIFSLGHFCDTFQSAKSSISEDLAIIKEIFEESGEGQLRTIAGAAGGVVFFPWMSLAEEEGFLDELAGNLSSGDRILPGGYLYMTDLIYSPEVVKRLGRIFARRFQNLKPDYVVTIETKGIPLALMTAEAMGVPLVIIRDSSRVTEGSAVNINYVSGSNHTISTMSLAKRNLPENSRVIVIDDFMKAGGTAKGMVDLLHEFKAEVLGIGVLITTKEPEAKLVREYLSLLELSSLDAGKREVQVQRLSPNWGQSLFGRTT